MIELKQAGFSYPGDETRVLDKINLTIEDGLSLIHILC